MFYDEWEVQEIVERARENDTLRPYANYLSQWVEIINGNSDGWAYWHRGSKAAHKLVDILRLPYRKGEQVPEHCLTMLKKALRPIKSCATRYKLPHPMLTEERIYG